VKTYLEPEEVIRMEAAARSLRDKLLIRLTFRLGCRVSEVLGIGVNDIDFGQGTITIEHLKLRSNRSCPDCGTRLNRQTRFCPGCGIKVEKVMASEKERRRIRILPLDIETLAMIRSYIDGGGLINSNGKRLLFGITRRRAAQIVDDCAKRARLGKLINPETGRIHNISPHRLRDAFAVHAVKSDSSADGLRLLQEHLGHQNLNTTMKYRKIAAEEHREWFNRLWEDKCQDRE